MQVFIVKKCRSDEIKPVPVWKLVSRYEIMFLNAFTSFVLLMQVYVQCCMYDLAGYFVSFLLFQFRFSNPLDVVMIVVGMVTGLASGVGLPGHMLLFGRVINHFVYYSVATETVRPRLSMLSSGNLTSYELFCNSSRVNDAVSMLEDNGTRVYLCTGSQGEEVFSEVLEYVCDPADELQDQIAVFAYYYLAIAVGVLLTTFLSNSLLNLSAYRQTRRMRRAFFRNVLRQEIGWFDVTNSAQLSTRLAE